MARLSVVLPVYNGAETVSDALESVRRQTRPADEIIVVDDGSSDSTAQVLQRARVTDGERLRVIRTEHRGLVPALNTGLEAATGDLIARMDADDTAHPDRFALQLAFLASRPEIGIVGSAATIPARADNGGYRRYVAWVNGLSHWRQIRRARFIESPLIHPTVMFRRRLVEEHGGYREGPFPEDYELWLRWFSAGVQAAAIPQPLLTWSDRADRFSRTPSAMQDRDSFFAVKGRYLAEAVATAAAGRPIMIWGAGRRSRRRMEPFGTALSAVALPRQNAEQAKPTDGIDRSDQSGAIVALVDLAARDPVPFGGRPLPVIGPEMLPPPTAAFVVSAVTTPGARLQIAKTLAGRGYRYERDWVAAG